MRARADLKKSRRCINPWGASRKKDSSARLATQISVARAHQPARALPVALQGAGNFSAYTRAHHQNLTRAEICQAQSGYFDVTVNSVDKAGAEESEMKIVVFGPERRLGALTGDRVIDLHRGLARSAPNQGIHIPTNKRQSGCWRAAIFHRVRRGCSGKMRNK